MSYEDGLRRADFYRKAAKLKEELLAFSRDCLDMAGDTDQSEGFRDNANKILATALVLIKELNNFT